MEQDQRRSPSSGVHSTRTCVCKETKCISSPDDLPENPTQALTERPNMVDQAPSSQNEHATSREARRDQKQSAKPTTCTFSGVVPIGLSRFLDSGIALVECCDYASTRTLEPRGGVLRFKSHNKRKTHTLTTSRRWARIDSIWDVVGM